MLVAMPTDISDKGFDNKHLEPEPELTVMLVPQCLRISLTKELTTNTGRLHLEPEPEPTVMLVAIPTDISDKGIDNKYNKVFKLCWLSFRGRMPKAFSSRVTIQEGEKRAVTIRVMGKTMI